MPETCWSTELDHWERELDKDELHPNPIGRAAVRRLRRHPPKPAQKLSVVHGDYRSGNFMHDGEGRILAILDWEMAHIGDPLEDLGWAIDPLWSHFDPTRVVGLLPRAEAIAVWEAVVGPEGRSRRAGLVGAVQFVQGAGDLDFGGQVVSATGAVSIRCWASPASTAPAATTRSWPRSWKPCWRRRHDPDHLRSPRSATS